MIAAIKEAEEEAEAEANDEILDLSPLQDDIMDLFGNNMSNNVLDDNSNNADIADRYMSEILGRQLWNQVSPLLSDKFKNDIGQGCRQQFAKDQRELEQLQEKIVRHYGVQYPFAPTTTAGRKALEKWKEAVDHIQQVSAKTRVNLVKFLAGIHKDTPIIEYYQKFVETTAQPPIVLPRNESMYHTCPNPPVPSETCANTTSNGYAIYRPIGDDPPMQLPPQSVQQYNNPQQLQKFIHSKQNVSQQQYQQPVQQNQNPPPYPPQQVDLANQVKEAQQQMVAMMAELKNLKEEKEKSPATSSRRASSPATLQGSKDDKAYSGYGRCRVSATPCKI